MTHRFKTIKTSPFETIKKLLASRDTLVSSARFRRIILLLAAAAVLLLLLVSYRFLFAVLLMVALSICIGLALRPFRSLTIGIEIGIFATVVSSMTHGIKAGIIVGLLVLTAKLLAEGSLSVYSLAIYPSHIIIAIAAGFFSGDNVMAVGIAAAIFHNLFTGFLTFFLLGAPMSKVLSFVSTNMVMNVLLFVYVAPAAVRMIG